MAQQTILKKISIKTAVEDSKFKNLKEKTKVLRLVGIGRSYSVGEHPQYGPFYKFIGEFVATDLRTGRTAVSSVAFLPSPVDEMLKQAIEAGEGSSGVEFAFDVSVNPREDLQIGYEYLVDTLIESKPTDPLSALMAALPAPEIAQGSLALDTPEKAKGKTKATA